MTIKQWIGDNGTGGNNVTTAVPAGSIDDPWNAVTLATATSFLTFGSTNPPFSGMLSARSQTTSGTDRVRFYHAFGATDTLSGRFYFRFRADPGVAEPLFAIIDNSGTFAQAVTLSLVTVSSTRHLILSSKGVQRRDFGAITFGTAATDIYRVECTATKGTTASNGTLKMKVFDSTGSAFGTEFTSTTTDVGTVQFIRWHYDSNSGVPMDKDVWASLSDDNPTGYYPGVYVEPADPPTIALQDYNDYTAVVATSAAGSGGTVSHTASPTIGVIEPRDGVFLFPRQAATGADYTATVTVTESPSGQTAQATKTVPKQTAGGNTNITAPRVPVGAAPGSTWS